jgi:ribonuclease III
VSGSTRAEWVATHLRHVPRDPALFVRALTHRSASSQNYERLEFLGDAVLSLLVSELLYAAYPGADEGDLSRLRARIVSEEPLAEMAQELAVGEQLVLGSGELRTGGFRRQSILADALEALCGALYLDGGFDAVRGALSGLLEARIAQLPPAANLKDAKTKLQEWLQARSMPPPNYSLLRAEGEPHAQTFWVECSIASLGVATQGVGHSRRRAEQVAAESALTRLPVAATASAVT